MSNKFLVQSKNLSEDEIRKLIEDYNYVESINNIQPTNGNINISLVSSSLNDLSDVSINLPSNRQTLIYNGVNWNNENIKADDITNTGSINNYIISQIEHTAYNSHIVDSSIHYTQSQIDHVNLLNKGVNTHNQIDTFINYFSNDLYNSQNKEGLLYNSGTSKFEHRSIGTSDVSSIVINGSHYLSEIINNLLPAGIIQGFNITFTVTDINVSSGQCYFLGGGVLRFFNSTSSYLNIPSIDNSLNFVYMFYNSGSPTISIQTSENNNENEYILLTKFYRTGSNIYKSYERQVVKNIIHASEHIERKRGIIRQSGGEISASGLFLVISTGSFYYGANEITSLSFNSATIQFEYYYYNGTNWVLSSTTNTIDNVNFNKNADSIASMGAGKYSAQYVYYSISDNKCIVIYGKTEDGSLSIIQNLNWEIPYEFPFYNSKYFSYLPFGRYIIQKNGTTPAYFQSYENIKNNNYLSALQSLNALSDVIIATPTNTQTILYNSSSSLFENRNILKSDIANLSNTAFNVPEIVNNTPVNSDIWYDGGQFKFYENGIIRTLSAGLSFPILSTIEGSSTAPCYSFQSSTNSGIYKNAINITICNSGNDILSIGNVSVTINNKLNLLSYDNITPSENDIWIDNTTKRLKYYSNTKTSEIPYISSSIENNRDVLIYNSVNTRYENRLLNIDDIQELNIQRNIYDAVNYADTLFVVSRDMTFSPFSSFILDKIMGLFDMNSIIGTNAIPDATGISNATAVGMTSANLATGLIGNCLTTTTASLQYIQLNSGFLFNETSSWTISTWLRYTSFSNLTAGYVGLISQRTNGNSGWFLRWISGTNQLEIMLVNSANTIHNSYYYNYINIFDNLWHNYIVIHDNSLGTDITSMKLYVDGVLYTASSQNIEGVLTSFSNSITPYIGYLAQTPSLSTNRMVYSIETTILLSKKVSNFEIQYIYNNGLSRANDAFYVSELINIYYLNGCSDVNIQGIQNNQILKYDESTTKWINKNDNNQYNFKIYKQITTDLTISLYNGIVYEKYIETKQTSLINIYLPANPNNNQNIKIFNNGTGNVNIFPSGTNTILNSSSYVIGSTSSINLIFNNNNWNVIPMVSGYIMIDNDNFISFYNIISTVLLYLPSSGQEENNKIIFKDMGNASTYNITANTSGKLLDGINGVITLLNNNYQSMNLIYLNSQYYKI